MELKHAETFEHGVCHFSFNDADPHVVHIEWHPHSGNMIPINLEELDEVSAAGHRFMEFAGKMLKHDD